MTHITNTQNPYATDAKQNHFYSYPALRDLKVKEQEWKDHLDFVEHHVIGEPKATDKYTSTQLSQMGIIGLYKKESKFEVGEIVCFNRVYAAKIVDILSNGKVLDVILYHAPSNHKSMLKMVSSEMCEKFEERESVNYH